jgi:hypothetical protein
MAKSKNATYTVAKPYKGRISKGRTIRKFTCGSEKFKIVYYKNSGIFGGVSYRMLNAVTGENVSPNYTTPLAVISFAEGYLAANGKAGSNSELITGQYTIGRKMSYTTLMV